MQDKTIINSLLYMRIQSLRGDKAGLEHIEALLRLMGYDPAKQLVRQHCPRRYRRNELRAAILDRLAEGPTTTAVIVEKFMVDKNIKDRRKLVVNISVTMLGLLERGKVARNGFLWRLA